MGELTWTEPAQALILQAGTGWEGIHALTYAAAFGALNLAMSVPLGVAVSVSYAAMDFRDAQDELEWARPHLRSLTAPVPFGQINPKDASAARAVLNDLATAALNRSAALAATDLPLEDQADLAHVMARLVTGRAKLTGRWS